MDADDRVYRELQVHLDRSPTGFPATASGADIRLLKHLLTPEEASIATQLSTMKPEPVKRIHRRLARSGISLPIEELEKKLDRMVYKGTILVYGERPGKKRYKNAGVSAGGMIDFQVNRLTPDLIADVDKYHEDSFRARQGAEKAPFPQLRTVPVEKSIPLPEKRMVSTYDDVRELVRSSPGPFSVANCVCRQMKDLRGQPCHYSGLRETCLQIEADHARQYVAMGIGRQVSREEVYRILDQAQAAGFILQPENSQHPQNICCCCGDCCGPLLAAVKSPRPADLYATNYYAEVDAALCTGCGTCLERCQLKARAVVEGKANTLLDRCIGCGNCVVTCPSGASRLRKKGRPAVPPRDKAAAHLKILEGKVGRWNALKLRTKMWLGLDV